MQVSTIEIIYILIIFAVKYVYSYKEKKKKIGSKWVKGKYAFHISWFIFAFYDSFPVTLLKIKPKH